MRITFNWQIENQSALPPVAHSISFLLLDLIRNIYNLHNVQSMGGTPLSTLHFKFLTLEIHLESWGDVFLQLSSINKDVLVQSTLLDLIRFYANKLWCLNINQTFQRAGFVLWECWNAWDYYKTKSITWISLTSPHHSMHPGQCGHMLWQYDWCDAWLAAAG